MDNNENNNLNSKQTKDVRKGLKKISIICTIFIVIILLCIFFYLGVIFRTSFTYQTKTTRLGLEDIGELVTQTCYVTVVEDTKNNRDFFKLFDIPFTESRQIFSYDVKVDASVNFFEISYTDNDESHETTVMIPHAKIYNCALNESSLKIYLDSESLFSRIDLEKHNEALNAMKEQAINDAKANGIIEAADKNAQTLIDGFIKSDDKRRDYKINYEYIGE